MLSEEPTRRHSSPYSYLSKRRSSARYQDRQWGQDVDDTLNTPWMWCAYLCSYATKWMKNPHRWTREDTEEFYDRMIQTSAIAAAAAESILRQREAHGKTFYESDARPEQ